MEAKKATGILVVGAGFLGSQRAAAARIAQGTTLIGIVDTDLFRARQMAAKFGVFAVDSLDDGLSLEGVDAVIVATPHADHVNSVEIALARSKHVLCEKPLAIEADDAWRLAQQADEAGLRLATGFNHRFYPPVRDALRLESEWQLGPIESLRVQIGHQATHEFLHGWHGDREQSGGGTLIDNGPHACDLIRRFLGEVTTAQGTIRHDPTGHSGCELDAFGLFRNHQHSVAELHSSWGLKTGYLTIEVRGASGWLKVETAPWRLTGQLVDGRRIDRRYQVDRLKERLYRRRYGCERSIVQELESFVAPSSEPRAGASGWDGCRAVEMIQAIYESDRHGRELSLTTRLSSSVEDSVPQTDHFG